MNYTLSLHCQNQPGIVATVSSYLRDIGCDIVDAQQFDDVGTGRFFMRVSFVQLARESTTIDDLKTGFDPIASSFGMVWQLRDRTQNKRVMLLVSKFDHCLVDLLYRRAIGELAMDITAIVSNHPIDRAKLQIDADTMVVHLPVTAATKAAQEAALLDLVESTKTDLVILARYMQILSDDVATKLASRCINIHHSFLPGFKGAKPYHQAFDRGVKLIGATAHFVTADLDEGPIIEQDVERISHRDRPDDLVAKGRDIERRVLARAVAAFLDDRVLPNGAKTVVFAP